MLFYVRRSLAYGQPMSRLLAANASSGPASAGGITNGASKTVNGKTTNGKSNGA